MPAQAGIQEHPIQPEKDCWIPALAGMTGSESKNSPTAQLIN